MVYSVEQDTSIIMSHYRNGTLVKGKCVYSVTACKQAYRDLIIQETLLVVHIRDFFELAVPTKGSLLEDLQYLKKLLMI